MDGQEFSSKVSLDLDSMGYNYETVKQRQMLDLSHIAEDFSVVEYDSACNIITGSIAEGISQIWSSNSDIDIMQVIKDTSVFEDTPDTKTFYKDDLVLQMECDNVAPGYTMIKYMKMEKSSMADYIEKELLVERNDCYYLRHSWTRQYVRHLRDSLSNSETSRKEDGDGEIFEMNFSGPAFSFILKRLHRKLNIDNVYAIQCFYSCHIRNWATRTRYYGWPDKQLISEVKKQTGYVVPVGFKGSKNFELEWRICYTGIQLSLIRCLNETQIKMYVLLKMVSKDILKPVCKDITSYVIKNLVLWIVERNAQEIFTPENLTSLVMLGLPSLRNKVNLKLFSSYMIPERNLFAEKITEHEKVETVRLLDEMLAEGPMFMIRFKELHKVKNAIEEIQHKPLLAEVKKKLWHYYSFMDFVDTDDSELNGCTSAKILLGLFLVVKELELDETDKEKLKRLFFELEKVDGKDDELNLNSNDFEYILRTLAEASGDIPSMIINFLALQ